MSSTETRMKRTTLIEKNNNSAKVYDVDFSKPVPKSKINKIMILWRENPYIVFPNQKLSNQDLEKFIQSQCLRYTGKKLNINLYTYKPDSVVFDMIHHDCGLDYSTNESFLSTIGKI